MGFRCVHGSKLGEHKGGFHCEITNPSSILMEKIGEDKDGRRIGGDGLERELGKMKMKH